MTDLLKAATALMYADISVIPTLGDKRPAVQWTPYQTDVFDET